jgi:lipooligosaccharide transport system ATP-binding protein
MAVLGLDPASAGRAVRRRIGVVTQEDALDEAMSVEENMALYASFIGLPKHVAEPRIKELLAYMSLSHRAGAKIITLSGGMKRRLVFVRALLGDPELLILDEPTTGLDPAVRQLLWDKIREMKRQGKTVLLTTHYMDEAEFLCDRLVILDGGKVQVHGAPRALIAEHCPGYVALWSTPAHPDVALDESAADPEGEGRRRAAHKRLDARSLPELAALIEREPVKPEVIRPSNLEDVFLKITGRELGGDA